MRKEWNLDLASTLCRPPPPHLVTLTAPGAVTAAPQTVEGTWKWMRPPVEPRDHCRPRQHFRGSSLRGLEPRGPRGAAPGPQPSETGETRSAVLSHYICGVICSAAAQKDRAWLLTSRAHMISYHCHPSQFSVTLHKSKYLRNETLDFTN